MRLASSARLLIEDGRLPVAPAAACKAILAGYRSSLRERVGAPVILGEADSWLREMAQGLWESWEPLTGLERSRKVPKDALRALRAMLPKGMDLDLRVRRAGLGSLGKPRFVALTTLAGGVIAREAKAVTPSSCAWAFGTESPSASIQAVRRAARSPDPFYAIHGAWLVRRLAPDCGKVEFGDTPRVAESARLLEYMGHETANIHRGTPGAREHILRDLKVLGPAWLKEASGRAVRITREDWEAWCRT